MVEEYDPEKNPMGIEFELNELFDAIVSNPDLFKDHLDEINIFIEKVPTFLANAIGKKMYDTHQTEEGFFVTVREKYPEPNDHSENYAYNNLEVLPIKATFGSLSIDADLCYEFTYKDKGEYSEYSLSYWEPSNFSSMKSIHLIRSKNNLNIVDITDWINQSISKKFTNGEFHVLEENQNSIIIEQPTSEGKLIIEITKFKRDKDDLDQWYYRASKRMNP